MTRLLREFRLVPIVLIAAGCLFVLKAVGLLLDGGYTLGLRASKTDNTAVSIPLSTSSQMLHSQTVPLEVATVPSSGRKLSWMQEMFNYPDATGSVRSGATSAKDSVIVTGSTNSAKPAATDASPADKAGMSVPPPAGKNQAPANGPTAVDGTLVPLDPSRPVSAAERAILGRLQGRRQELDARARELDIREGMLQAAEKKLEVQLGEIKAAEERLNASMQKKNEAEGVRLKGLVTMYENMKARDAAKIFDRLDNKVLLDVVTQINPRRMSEILAQMSPEVAERLTVDIANRSSDANKEPNPADLPKIEGRPNGT
jgi:flagellar motility protein MotE (MotC chaperone)